AKNAHLRCVFSREIFGTDPRSATNPHMLNGPVIQNRERFTVICAEEKNQPTIRTGTNAVPFFRLARLLRRPAHDVGLYAAGINAVVSTFHRTPPIVAVGFGARYVDVYSGSMCSYSVCKFTK